MDELKQILQSAITRTPGVIEIRVIVEKKSLVKACYQADLKFI